MYYAHCFENGRQTRTTVRVSRIMLSKNKKNSIRPSVSHGSTHRRGEFQTSRVVARNKTSFRRAVYSGRSTGIPQVSLLPPQIPDDRRERAADARTCTRPRCKRGSRASRRESRANGSCDDDDVLSSPKRTTPCGRRTLIL